MNYNVILVILEIVVGNDLYQEKKCSLSIDHDPKNCLNCVYKVLYSLNLHVSSYSYLCEAYEFFLTLSVTQVNCERTFSKLKITKNRLRSNLSSENLEALLIMSIEKQMLEDVEVSDIINYLKSTSTLMLNMFT